MLGQPLATGSGQGRPRPPEARSPSKGSPLDYVAPAPAPAPAPAATCRLVHYNLSDLQIELQFYGMWELFQQLRGEVESVAVELEYPIQPNSLYVIGGHVGGEGHELDTVFVFIPNLNKWVESVSKMPRSTHDHAAVFLNGGIYCIGGRNGGGETKHVIRIDQDNRWRPMADLGQARFNHLAVAMQGCIYVCGGWQGERLSSCERYDPEDDSWVPIASMNHGRAGGAAVVCDDKIYVVGGYGKDMKGVEIYDPMENLWSQGTPMNIGREGSAVCLYDNKLYAFGGVSAEEDPISSIEVRPRLVRAWGCTGGWCAVTQEETLREGAAALRRAAPWPCVAAYVCCGPAVVLRRRAHCMVWLCAHLVSARCRTFTQCFDPETNKWSLLRAELPDAPGRGLGGCCVVEDNIYITGVGRPPPSPRARHTTHDTRHTHTSPCRRLR